MEWFDYRFTELENKEKQKEVFTQMLRALENQGKCRMVFHALAFALFKDYLEN